MVRTDCVVVELMATSKLQERIWIYCPEDAGVRGNVSGHSLASKTPFTWTLTMGTERVHSHASNTPFTRTLTMGTDMLQEIEDRFMRDEMAIKVTARSRLLE